MKTAGLSPPFFILIRLLRRHCERSEAIHLSAREERWIASSLALLAMTWRELAQVYFFFAPTRLMLLIASGVRPDFSAISRSCSMM